MNPSTTVTTNNPKITRALLSVSDKTGILELAKTLQEMGVEILSTGGTAQLLSSRGIAVTEVSQHTGFPEIMDGRVKTLHPKIHGGILARRDKPEHLNAMTEHHIGPIDLVAVNLYPFENTTAAPEVRMEDAIENIDIGGPAMVRASAKNYPFVTILVDPSDYPKIVDELKTHQGQTTLQTRKQLAAKAYAHTSRYDGAIAAFLSSTEGDGNLQDTPKRNAYPNTLTQQWHKVEDLRYGENPHQTAAFYRDAQAPLGLLSNYRQLQGKALSFNNIADADAAWECVKTFHEPACVIVKHANPCGVAIGVNALEAYQKALSTDPTSAFGGIVAFNGTVNATTIEAVTQLFVEVLIAPQFDEAALALLAKKPNVRVLQIPLDKTPHRYDLKRVGGGLLVQTPDAHELTRAQCQVVSVKQPSESQWADLLFAWNCAKFIKSNAIVYCKNSMTLGIGAGQMSRIDSARIASIKAEQAGFNLQGSAVASDAFFPFRDGLDVVVDAGAECVIHPGGSIRDEEVIAAANERGVVMVFTGVRHFRH